MVHYRAPAVAGLGRRVDLISDDQFHRIYQAHSRPLWSFLYRACRDATVADDLLQEVFCRYLEAPASSRDEVGLGSYLLRIGSNLAIDRGRRLARDRVDPGAGPAREFSCRFD